MIFYLQIALLILSFIVTLGLFYEWRYFEQTHELSTAQYIFFSMIVAAIATIVIGVIIIL